MVSLVCRPLIEFAIRDVLVLDTGGTVEEVQVGELAEQPQCPVHALFGQLIPMCQSEISL